MKRDLKNFFLFSRIKVWQNNLEKQIEIEQFHNQKMMVSC